MNFITIIMNRVLEESVIIYRSRPLTLPSAWVVAHHDTLIAILYYQLVEIQWPILHTESILCVYR